MNLSQKLADFKAEADEGITYLAANATALEVPAGQVTAATGAKSDYDTNYDVYADASTHTPGSVIDVHVSYQTTHHLWAGLQQQIKHNKNLTLNGEKITKLHLHLD